MFKNLIHWSTQYNHLPWRKNRSLYGTLVSEIMLQQTTVGTVLSHFEKFMKAYPTIQSLAKASNEELTISWKGLGYYRRARNLKKACEYIVNEFQGEIPLNYETLLSIPGIGPYTASAIIAIGANKPALAIDANLERVIARLYGIQEEKGPKLQKKIQELYQQKKIMTEMTKLSPRDLNEAFMDLGRSLCKSRSASCELCPLSKKCVALKEGKTLDYPIQTIKKQEGFELKLLRFVYLKGNKILVYRKSENEWLSGQYEVPTFVLECDDKTFKQYPTLKKKMKWEKLPLVKTGITKYKIENYIQVSDTKKIPEGNYVWKEISDKSNLSISTKKILDKINY